MTIMNCMRFCLTYFFPTLALNTLSIISTALLPHILTMLIPEFVSPVEIAANVFFTITAPFLQIMRKTTETFVIPVVNK